jgi:anaerobic ribonucleoside-triphosphate reductase
MTSQPVTVTYTTNNRNVATVTAHGRSVQMTTLVCTECPNCGSRTYTDGYILRRRPLVRTAACC